MILVPLPFVVSLLLVIVLVQMWRRAEDGLAGNLLFFLLITLYAIQSLVIGLRWGYGMRSVMLVQPVFAAMIASLAWVSFRNLTHEGLPLRRVGALLHALPALAVAFLVAFWPQALSASLTLIFAGYGAALFRLSIRGPDALAAVRLDGVVRSHRSLQITAFALVSSAVSDLLISLDYTWSDGRYSGAIIAFGNLLALLVLGGAASVAGAEPSRDTPGGAEQTRETADERPMVTQEDAEVAASVDLLMQETGLYKDLDLNLGRLARKLRLPVRQVSLAINRVRGMSVSHYVNNCRIAEACRLLEMTDDPVTKIMFDAGFLTKSNFNREFLRVTGTNPKAWRQAKTKTIALAA